MGGSVFKIMLILFFHQGIGMSFNIPKIKIGIKKRHEFKVTTRMDNIPSDTSDRFYLAEICFSPQTDHILDYSIDWGLAPMDMFIGRVFEEGQMVCHSRMYKERERHILQVQVENSDGSIGTKSSDVVLRQRIYTTSTSCVIGHYEQHLRRL